MNEQNKHWRRWVILLVLWLSGCQGIMMPSAGTIPPTQSGTAVSGARAGVYDNPIIPEDFPDPFILPVGDSYYAYSTNVDDANVPVVRLSQDFATYERLGDALPDLPLWAAAHQSLIWAPAVLIIMFFITPCVTVTPISNVFPVP